MPAVHPVSSTQPPAQTLPEQRAPPQLTVPAVGQVADEPLHVDGSVALQTPPGHAQLGPLHCTPGLPGACWQVVEEPLQRSVVQGFPSSRQAAPAFPAGVVQAPLTHWSRVQGFASAVHSVPSGFAGFEQMPFAGLHVPALWHWSLAVQVRGGLLTQVPPEHVSVVHALLSVQLPELFAGCAHVTEEPLHWSKVQGLPSSGHEAPGLPAGC